MEGAGLGADAAPLRKRGLDERHRLAFQFLAILVLEIYVPLSGLPIDKERALLPEPVRWASAHALEVALHRVAQVPIHNCDPCHFPFTLRLWRRLSFARLPPPFHLPAIPQMPPFRIPKNQTYL